MSDPTTCACGGRVMHYCHSCGVALCAEHALGRLLVAHCKVCWERDHAREDDGQTRGAGE